MTPPAQAAFRFGAACLVGALLGIVYGFLRPIKRTWVKDILFVIAAFWAFLYVSFSICRADVRMSYTAGIFIGCAAWEMSFGRWLRGVFAWIWELLRWPFHIFYNFLKILTPQKECVII